MIAKRGKKSRPVIDPSKACYDDRVWSALWATLVIIIYTSTLSLWKEKNFL